MAGNSLRVLVVDDELLIRWSLSEGLTASGHSVLQAETALEALGLIENSRDPVDAVVLDYHLPDSYELQLFTSIRERLPRAAIVIMTGFIGANAKAEALARGAYAVVIKPFNVIALERLLLRAVAAQAEHPTHTRDAL